MFHQPFFLESSLAIQQPFVIRPHIFTKYRCLQHVLTQMFSTGHTFWQSCAKVRKNCQVWTGTQRKYCRWLTSWQVWSVEELKMYTSCEEWNHWLPWSKASTKCSSWQSTSNLRCEHHCSNMELFKGKTGETKAMGGKGVRVGVRQMLSFWLST